MRMGATALLAAPAQAEPVRRSGNGHLYEVVVVPEGITWPRSPRRGKPVRLVADRQSTPLLEHQPPPGPDRRRRPLDRPGADSPPSAGAQGRLAVDQRRALAYANWAAGKPNNLEQIEDDGHLFRVAGSQDPATWNDFANDPTQLSVVRAQRPVAYIVEFDRNPAR